MFTGITSPAVVTGLDKLARSARVTVQHRFAGLDDGESIAVNGCCLTVADQQRSPGFGQLFTADVSAETLRRTTLGELRPGRTVNVERAATVGTLLGGHLVQGHVDAVAEILDLRPGGDWTELVVAIPPAYEPYIAEKGSVTLDGVSLTVASLQPKAFTVALIPTTLHGTTLGAVSPGTALNLEVDALSRYVYRQLQAHRELAAGVNGHGDDGDPTPGAAGAGAAVGAVATGRPGSARSGD